MTARLLQCSIDDYHRDPCAVPSLSSSIAKTLIQKSPAHAWLEHPRMGNQRKPPSEDMDEGTLIHKLLLGEGAIIQIIAADNFRTKVAQEARDAATARGAVPVLARKYDAAQIAVAKIRENIAACGINLDGANEVAIEWQEDGVLGDPVTCRCRLDHAWIDDGRIIDIKKCESAHPKDAARAVVTYSYALQAVAYTRALEALKPEFQGRAKFAFLFVEIEPPYAVLPAWLSGTFVELGTRQWTRAVRTWERCLAANDWPGYSREAIPLIAPPWAFNDKEAADGI